MKFRDSLSFPPLYFCPILHLSLHEELLVVLQEDCGHCLAHILEGPSAGFSRIERKQ